MAIQIQNLFEASVLEDVVLRLEKLRSDTPPLWGKMTVAQMLAHCMVAYEMVYEDKHDKPSRIMKLVLRWVAKPIVVSDKPYKHNSPTAPAFVIRGDKDFESEKERLIHTLRKTHQLGEGYFEGRESASFGPLTAAEWNMMFYKHLDHHLKQFGA